MKQYKLLWTQVGKVACTSVYFLPMPGTAGSLMSQSYATKPLGSI